MSQARQEILDRIRRASGQSSGTRPQEFAAIPRDFARSGSLSRAQRVALFEDRLRDYGCDVHHASEPAISASIAHILHLRQKGSMLIPPGLPSNWLPPEFAFIEDRALTNSEIEKSDGVITGCALAIAATGTIVLQHSLDAGRRVLTLLPDYHLCVVFENQVVETVAEAIEQLGSVRTRPITTISGPSATSDIEMTRIKGVHGPRILDVLLVGETLP